MVGSKTSMGLLALAALVSASSAQSQLSKEQLILCDCGIGDDPSNPSWSTSRQANFYNSLDWPSSAYSYPPAPAMAAQVPYADGLYPWIPSGAHIKFPDRDEWTAYIEDGTPDGFKAGTAVRSKGGSESLACWAYRGRPISAALNTTVNHDAICWTAFVCNTDDHPPPRPADMGSQTSTLTTSPAAPATSFFTEPNTGASTPTPGQPTPTTTPQPGAGTLDVYATVNPRFINWQNTWEAFISNFIWDQTTGRCVGGPIHGNGYNISIECAGIQIDSDTHMTLLMIKALRDVGLHSLWFNQNPIIPGTNGTAPSTGPGWNSTVSWVVMPEAFSIQATDAATRQIVGTLSYKTNYAGFLSGPCSSCETGRFNKDFFDPIIAAVEGSYPTYHNFSIEGQCSPWMVCK